MKRAGNENPMLDAMTTNRACDLCGGLEFKPIGEQHFPGIPTTSGQMDFQVPLVCCSRCGLVFQEPLPDGNKLRSYYASMYREEVCRERSYIEEEGKLRVDFASRFLDSQTIGTILEVGCADGTTLSGFQQKGFKVFGIEPSLENSDICKKKGLAVFTCSYEDLPISTKDIDLVCSYYVMEHLRSPTDFLLFCNRMLNLRGILSLEIPDIGAYKQELTVSNLLFFFEHMYHFTRATVELLLSKCGFRLLEFANKASHKFGMHLAAQKVSVPLGLDNLTILDGLSQSVMREISEYQTHFQEKIIPFRHSVGHLFSGNAAKANKTVIFGAGSYAIMILQMPEVSPGSVQFVVDNNPRKWGTFIEGLPIHPPSAIDASVNLVVVASSYHQEICEQLETLGIDRRRVVIL